ncbi:YolD-like family protein [Paenibacillus crassostreae]|uniref:YolD-like family protein n=1 Tax=Paenibacillus crassostreae TaxID=1763538 RepID=A0A167C5T7_9BACL|nr:YolD-like family protein [Paenibacillus crassostreae]AOZ91612.1 hypothetical protein LPB68_04865 [Paenibacillus crassostreae]OAB72814.1 hypothetical protein PNBC_15385 [Paenibacillus crassostreae]
MSKRLEGNGLYESMRMIIPQHKEAVIKQAQEIHRRKKPNLDEQQWETVERAIGESLNEHATITLQVYGPFENKELRGIVESANIYRQEIKFIFDGEWEWIKFENIISAEV